MLEIYQASCENVREMKRQISVVKQMFNDALIHNREQEVNALTKIYALLYSSYAEVSFLKLIHTPHGFTDDYIRQIQFKTYTVKTENGVKERSRPNNLEDQWTICIDFVLKGIANMVNAGDLANKRQKLHTYLSKYVIEPSQIRNKIAHGQWLVCLNNDNTAKNDDTTDKLKSLDFVQIDNLFAIYDLFLQCVEDLIESPYKTHFRDYYSSLEKMEKHIKRTRNYTLEGKREELKKKELRIKAAKAAKNP